MIPALLIRMSRRPNRSTAASTSACAPAVVATSWVSAIAAPPAATISAAVEEAGSASAPVALHRTAEVVDDDAGASPGEQACVRSAEAASRARDDGDTTLEAALVHPKPSAGVYRPVSILPGLESMPRTAGSDEPGRSAKWKARRDVIIDTSAGVFARGGYHATGIVELCAANGLGKGAFYHYIQSKEELLAAIHDRVIDEVMLGADRVADAGGSPSEQLAMLGTELLDVIHRYPDHVWVFLHEFPALTDERAEQFRVRRREYERRVEAVLQAGIDAGEFRDIDPRLTAFAWLGMHNYTYLWLKAGGRVSARDVAKPFADIFIRGIGSALGPRAHRGLEPQEPAERAAHHLGPLLGGHIAEQLRQELPAPAERPFGVRVVVAPHDRRQPRDVPARNGDRVVLEGDMELASDVLARLQRVRPLLVQAEQLRHAGLIVGRARVVPVPEPPVRRPGRSR